MYSEDAPDHEERPWIVLTTTYDVEAWIDQFNRNLQRLAPNANAAGYGICFRLNHGGEIFLHTTAEGVVLLDVTDEAAWVAPVLTARDRRGAAVGANLAIARRYAHAIASRPVRPDRYNPYCVAT